MGADKQIPPRGRASGDSQEFADLLEQAEALIQEPEMDLQALMQGAMAGLRCQDDPRARWIARGLGRPVAELEPFEADSRAGEDEGKIFYILTLNEMKLAVRQDGMRAYVTEVSDLVDAAGVARVLEQLGLKEVEGFRGGKAGEAGGEDRPSWTRVVEGKEPVAGQAVRIDCCCPGEPADILKAESLSQISREVRDLFRSGQLNPETVSLIDAPSAVPGEVVARVIEGRPGQDGQDVFGRPVPAPVETPDVCWGPGPFVSLSADGEFRAERLGYLCLSEGQLSVVSPVWIDAEEMQAHWVVLDRQVRPVTPEMIHQCLADLEVVEGIREEEIAALAARVRAGEHECGTYLIAAGAAPVEGKDAQIEILVDVERQAGEEREDGSIDFREVNSTPNVKAGQKVAQRVPARPGAVGKNVRGNVIDASDGVDQSLRAGLNVRVERRGKAEEFFAEKNGILRLSGEELSVVELLSLKGDVTFHTGNLDFDGEIYLDGSVKSGFSVKGTREIAISGTVEPGSEVISHGDITVGRGVVGCKSRVVAGGSVRVQFVQEATVISGGDITVGNYVYHANLRAGGRVTVHQGTGQRGGSIVGGQTWALKGMDMHLGGGPNGASTVLVAGIRQEQVQKFDKLRQGIEQGNKHIARLLERFGMTRIDPVQIRNMIAASSGPRRKILVNSSQQLGKIARVYKQLLTERQKLERQMEDNLQNAAIRVRETAFPGLKVRLGEQQRTLVEELEGPVFRLVDGKLVDGVSQNGNGRTEVTGVSESKKGKRTVR